MEATWVFGYGSLVYKPGVEWLQCAVGSALHPNG